MRSTAHHSEQACSCSLCSSEASTCSYGQQAVWLEDSANYYAANCSCPQLHQGQAARPHTARRAGGRRPNGCDRHYSSPISWRAAAEVATAAYLRGRLDMQTPSDSIVLQAQTAGAAWLSSPISDTACHHTISLRTPSGGSFSKQQQMPLNNRTVSLACCQLAARLDAARQEPWQPSPRPSEALLQHTPFVWQPIQAAGAAASPAPHIAGDAASQLPSGAPRQSNSHAKQGQAQETPLAQVHGTLGADTHVCVEVQDAGAGWQGAQQPAQQQPGLQQQQQFQQPQQQQQQQPQQHLQECQEACASLKGIEHAYYQLQQQYSLLQQQHAKQQQEHSELVERYAVLKQQQESSRELCMDLMQQLEQARQQQQQQERQQQERRQQQQQELRLQQQHQQLQEYQHSLPMTLQVSETTACMRHETKQLQQLCAQLSMAASRMQEYRNQPAGGDKPTAGAASGGTVAVGKGTCRQVLQQAQSVRALHAEATAAESELVGEAVAQLEQLGQLIDALHSEKFETKWQLWACQQALRAAEEAALPRAQPSQGLTGIDGAAGARGTLGDAAAGTSMLTAGKDPSQPIAGVDLDSDQAPEVLQHHQQRLADLESRLAAAAAAAQQAVLEKKQLHARLRLSILVGHAGKPGRFAR